MAIKPKILFVYESNHPIVVKDGLWTALDVLESTFEIERINIADDPKLDIPGFDFVLGWGGFCSKVDDLLQNYKNNRVGFKIGLCLAGNVYPHGIQEYDLVFYETKWVRDFVGLKYMDCELIQAFGYNDLVYKDLGITVKDIDYLGVGAFARWKRWEKFLDKKGSRRVIGEFQQGNPVESQEIWDLLEKDGVLCKDMVKPELLNLEYNRAKTVYIPADIYGGGERAILEARACGCKIEIEPDNPKLKEVMNMPLWTQVDYAKKLKEAICELL